MVRHLRSLSLAAAATATALVMTACGGDDDADTAAATSTASSAAAATTAPPAATTAAATTAAATSAAATSAAATGGAKVAVAKHAKLGDVVVDAQGFTLYRFDKDTAAPPKSNCAAECLANWPAAVTTGKPAAAGVDAALVSTVKRADGTEQITLGGWPLYRFAADTKAGDANGQAVGGVWWAVTPTGDKVAAAG